MPDAWRLPGSLDRTLLPAGIHGFRRRHWCPSFSPDFGLEFQGRKPQVIRLLQT
ncbi:hypothetical protein B0H19DRAFT_1137390 [Mycena capillaripes]|nr:hypothetical protein B0H19DRAFT_1137390 [Mycena capillaripes]